MGKCPSWLERWDPPAGRGLRQAQTLLVPPKVTFSHFLSSHLLRKWLRIVDNVRTIIQQSEDYIYIPDLRTYSAR